MDIVALSLLVLIVVCIFGLLAIRVIRRAMGITRASHRGASKRGSRKQVNLYYYQGDADRILCAFCDGENRAGESCCRICGKRLR